MNKLALVTLLVAGSAFMGAPLAHGQNKKKPVSKTAPVSKEKKPVVQEKKAESQVKDTVVHEEPVEEPPVKGVLLADGFTHMESGLEYNVVRHGTGKRHPHIGDHLEMHVHLHIKDSVMFDSRKMNSGNPVPFQVQPASFRGDFIEGLMMLVAGDSAHLRLPVDTIIKQNKQLMPGMKAGEVLEYDIVLVSVMSRSEYKKDQFEKAQKESKIEDSIFTDYFTRNNIKPQKTASGLYYTISREGTGELPKPGQVMSVNYTGRFLEGKTFDSNTDPDFHHPEPFPVPLGRGAVIKGWDEGLALLKNGTKAVLYIPSGLAYGSQGNSNIPGNTILVFDVEIVGIKTQAEHDDKLITDYIAKNKIKAKKTESGLYYRIIKEGKGDLPTKGEKLSVNYTGSMLDGHKFDSNVDTNFHHAQPLEFPLGQGVVIKGWEEGLALLPKGSKAVFIVPSGMAYGVKGHQESSIPPNAILLFDVELLDVKKP